MEKNILIPFDKNAYRENSEPQLNAILEGNPIPTFVVDPAGRITHWNHACELLTRVLQTEIIGTDKHRVLFYNERREVLADFIARGASEAELSIRYKGKYRRSALIQGGYEGEDFFPKIGDNGKWLFYTAAPVKDQHGKVVGAVETIQDTTSLRMTERALDASETYYSLLFERANDAILILKEGIIAICNQKALDLFRCTREEIVGHPPLMFSPERQLDGELSRTAMAQKKTILLRNQPIVFEWRFLRKDGSAFDAEVSLTLFQIGDTPQAIAIIRDIARQKEMIHTLEAHKNELNEKSSYLEKVNLALKAALDHREIEKRAVEAHLVANLKRLVFPYLDALGKCKLGMDAHAYVNIINTNLSDIVSQFSTTVISKYIDFTPAEIRVADFIREGKNTKEIAELLGLSPSSVKWHRKNIRKKLGLTNKALNLYTYLNSLGE